MSFNPNSDQATNWSDNQREGFDINANSTGTYPSDQGNVSANDYDQNDTQFAKVARGTGGFDTTNTTAGSGYAQGQSDNWNQSSGNDTWQSSRTNIGSDSDLNQSGFQPSGTATGDDYGSLPGQTAGNARSWRGPGQQEGTGNDWKQSSGANGTGQTNDQWDDTTDDQGRKPKVSDKMMGGAEKLMGSITGNQGMKERGQERKTGDY